MFKIKQIIANFRKARLGGVAINYFGFWITILANTDCLLSKLFFSQSMFWHYRYSKCHTSGNNVNVDGIEVSSFCSECALFEYVIKCEYVFTDKRLILTCAVVTYSKPFRRPQTDDGKSVRRSEMGVENCAQHWPC